MTLSSTNVATTLGGIPIGDPGRLATDLEDRLAKTARRRPRRQAKAVLKGANLDQLADYLKSKLDLGPVQARRRREGQAQRRRHGDDRRVGRAAGPADQARLQADPRRRPGQRDRARAGCGSRASTWSAPSAFLGGVHIEDMVLDYDGSAASTSQGKLLFPPVNSGIAINRFRLDGRGQLPGARRRLPGRLGPGHPARLRAVHDQDRRRAVARPGRDPGAHGDQRRPELGGGCPTVGMDAAASSCTSRRRRSSSTPPATVGLVCIPLGSAHFYADSTGLVDVGAGVYDRHRPALLHGGPRRPAPAAALAGLDARRGRHPPRHRGHLKAPDRQPRASPAAAASRSSRRRRLTDAVDDLRAAPACASPAAAAAQLPGAGRQRARLRRVQPVELEPVRARHPPGRRRRPHLHASTRRRCWRWSSIGRGRRAARQAARARRQGERRDADRRRLRQGRRRLRPARPRALAHGAVPARRRRATGR